MADDKPEQRLDDASTSPEPLDPNEPGCCFVEGREPFSATRQECISVGGNFIPGPCP